MPSFASFTKSGRKGPSVGDARILISRRRGGSSVDDTRNRYESLYKKSSLRGCVEGESSAQTKQARLLDQ